MKAASRRTETNFTKDGSVRALLWSGRTSHDGYNKHFRMLVSMVAVNTEKNGGHKLLLT